MTKRLWFNRIILWWRTLLIPFSFPHFAQLSAIYISNGSIQCDDHSYPIFFTISISSIRRLGWGCVMLVLQRNQSRWGWSCLRESNLTGSNPSTVVCRPRYDANIWCCVKPLPGTDRNICCKLCWLILSTFGIECKTSTVLRSQGLDKDWCKHTSQTRPHPLPMGCPLVCQPLPYSEGAIEAVERWSLRENR